MVYMFVSTIKLFDEHFQDIIISKNLEALRKYRDFLVNNGAQEISDIVDYGSDNMDEVIKQIKDGLESSNFKNKIIFSDYIDFATWGDRNKNLYKIAVSMK